MNLAIVGTSRLSDNEERDARQLISHIIKSNSPDLIISGGANGIDIIAEDIAKQLRVPVMIFSPVENNWNSYKQRNIEIATLCDELYCITTKIKDKRCYHCDLDHQRTGGCYTKNLANNMRKTTHVMVIER